MEAMATPSAALGQTLANLPRLGVAQDRRIDALEESVKALGLDILELQADHAKLRVAMGTAVSCPIDAVLCHGGEFASRLESQLVNFVWPGHSATAPRSPLRHLAPLCAFFEAYLDEDGRLKQGVAIPRRYGAAPDPTGGLLGGNADALVETHKRWALVTDACPSVVELVGELKTVRETVAYVKPPPASSAKSLLRALDVAHKQCACTCTCAARDDGASDDDRVTRVQECLEALEGLAERLQLPQLQ